MDCLPKNPLKKVNKMVNELVVSSCRIDLWNVNSDNPKSPRFNGYVTVVIGDETVKLPVSVWNNVDAVHPKAPALKGKISRPSPKLERPPLIEGVTVTVTEVPSPLPF